MDIITMSINAPSVDKNTITKCKKECKLDETRQFCTGCLRTMKEITQAGLDRKEIIECGKQNRKTKEDTS